MNEEQTRILRMVAAGQLSPEEAAGLLDAVEQVRESEPEPAWEAGIPGTPPTPGMPGNPYVADHRAHRKNREGRVARAVVIQVREGGENRVNIRVPLSLARVAGKFIPRQAQQYLANYEINLQDFLADVGDADGGTLLEVKEGENRVLIAVE